MNTRTVLELLQDEADRDTTAALPIPFVTRLLECVVPDLDADVPGFALQLPKSPKRLVNPRHGGIRRPAVA